MSRRARILFYCKQPRIGIYSIQLTPWIMSEPFRIWFRHVRNNLAYRHSVELHQMVRNSYSVSIRWVVKTVQCSLPMWTRRGNPPCRVCLLLFNATRRGNPSHCVCLLFFDAMRRGNPPCCICWIFYDAMRRGNPPRHVYFLLNDPTPPSRGLCV